MIKEIMISIIIVLSIITLDFITQNYTKETVKDTSTMLENLKEKINSNDNDVSNRMNEIYKIWEERREKLAYFIEHDELEKVETNLTNIRTFIEVADWDMAISGIEEAEFLLEHIKEKNAFTLENIF